MGDLNFYGASYQFLPARDAGNHNSTCQKDTQQKDDVRLGHKLSLAAAMDVTLWRKERHTGVNAVQFHRAKGHTGII